jgi:thiamine-monophosphate kinase
VQVDALPRSAELRALPQALQRTCTLAGGDDYELVFTAPPARAAQVQAAARAAQVGVTRFGRVVAEGGLRLLDDAGATLPNTFGSFDHFKA